MWSCASTRSSYSAPGRRPSSVAEVAPRVSTRSVRHSPAPRSRYHTAASASAPPAPAAHVTRTERPSRPGIAASACGARGGAFSTSSSLSAASSAAALDTRHTYTPRSAAATARSVRLPPASACRPGGSGAPSLRAQRTAGGGAAGAAARRLAALRHAPAAALLARVAQHAHAHASTAERRSLLAAALTYAAQEHLQDMLKARLNLELESLQQMGAALRDNSRLEARWPSTEEEFADAITTPVIEKKDLITPTQADKKPLLNYLLDSFQNKFSLSSGKSTTVETSERTVHCQEFYRSLYPEHDVCTNYYCYDRFSVPDDIDGQAGVGQAVLKWLYIQSCLDTGDTSDVETEVVHKCAEEILYKDTPLSIACLLRSTQDYTQAKKLIEAQHTDAAVSAALYATLVKCNSPELRDNVYLAEPRKMACMTLKQNNASEEQMAIIRQCIDKLSGMGEVLRIRRLGLTVNGLLFNADTDYRQEIIYRLARLGGAEHAKLACSLASKYGLDSVEVWLQYAREAQARAEADTLPPTAYTADAVNRIRDALWPEARGNDHAALINFFTILKSIDEKTQLCGLTVLEHIKLLKKAKAASPELDYKLLLEQPSAEVFTAHVLSIIKPENVGLLTKFLRTLPPAFKIPVSVNSLYTLWLTKYFFSEGTMGGNKKWMQAWRQCASYFTKLAKDELLKFVAATCFSAEALQRVPAGTRNLMIMQAVDYCQQEQENDYKFNKNEQTWAQIGQELTRWARFLENYHSSSVQAIVDNSDVPRDQGWTELEMSHGDVERVVSALARLVLRGAVRAPALTSLLQCLHVALRTDQVFAHVLQHCVHDLDDIQTLVTRLTQYHKGGVRFSEEFLEQVMGRATELGLPPHKQLGVLSLSERGALRGGGDLRQVARSTVDLFRTEWPHSEYALNLTDEKLLTVEGRREVFSTFAQRCDTRQQQKALVDVLACWPPTADEGRSLQCEYLAELLARPGDPREARALIQLLLRRPVLRHEDICWLVESVTSNSVVNTLWVLLLNKCARSEELLCRLVQEHKETILNISIEDELIKEMLDQGMFIKLVSTPLYTSIVNYILSTEASSGEPASPYTVAWATAELLKANYLAEAGHLQMMSTGIPSALRGFSQTVQYCKNLLK